MDDYVTKFEKRCCMVFALEDLLSEETQASKMADFWSILHFSLSLIEIMVY